MKEKSKSEQRKLNRLSNSGLPNYSFFTFLFSLLIFLLFAACPDEPVARGKTQIAKPSLVQNHFTYNGSPHTVALTEENTAYMLGGDITGTVFDNYTATVILTDTERYEWEDGTSYPLFLTWTINRADHVVTWPTASNIPSGSPLAFSVLSGGIGDGVFAWTESGTVPTGINSYSVTFIPRDIVNYNVLRGMVSVTVTYTVSFDLDGGSGTGDYSAQTIAHGDTATPPAVNPGKEMHHFINWVNADNNTEWDFGNSVTANISLKARWEFAIGPWTARQAAEDNPWYSVTYGNGLFVAVAVSGTNQVMTSPDGINWTARQAAQANLWYSVSYGSGLFVAVARDGTNRVMTSPDGIDWTARQAAEDNYWTSVTYGNGLFVAVARDGTNRVMTSPNGIDWTARQAAEDNGWNYVTYGNGLFVAVASDGTNRVMTSPDGINWTAQQAAQANSWVSVTYGSGLFVAVASNGTNRVMTSPDGINWTARQAAEANFWHSVSYGNGLFVAVAIDGTNQVMTSPDGIDWTARQAAQTYSWNSVTYGKGLFVAVAVGRVIQSVMTAEWPTAAPILTKYYREENP